MLRIFSEGFCIPEIDSVFKKRFKDWRLVHPRLWTAATDPNDIVDFVSDQIDRIVKSQIETADRIIVSQDRVRSEIDRVALGVDRVTNGMTSLGATFEWGFSELVWQLEEQREVLRNILQVMEAPLDTQGKELKKRALYAKKNGWVTDALKDFLESEKKNRYDFDIHENLGDIYFNKENHEKALKYYEKAAKYAAPKSHYHASIAFLNIAKIKYLQGNSLKAYEATSKALELSPDFSEAHYQHAQHCANIGRYNEALEHLRIAIAADRYYCVKIDSERDFDVMKEQWVSLKKELRKNACGRAKDSITRAKKLIKDVEFFGVPDDLINVGKSELNSATIFYNRDSYFDYLDAYDCSTRAQNSFVESSVKFLSEQISEKEGEYKGNLQQCKEKAEGDSNIIAMLGISLFVFPAILTIIFTVLTYFLTSNILSTLGVGTFLWFVGWIIYAVGSSNESLLYKKYSKKYKESYENQVATLKKNLSIIRPLCRTCQEPLTYVQQYKKYYCFNCQKNASN